MDRSASRGADSSSASSSSETTSIRLRDEFAGDPGGLSDLGESPPDSSGYFSLAMEVTAVKSAPRVPSVLSNNAVGQNHNVFLWV